MFLNIGEERSNHDKSDQERGDETSGEERNCLGREYLIVLEYVIERGCGHGRYRQQEREFHNRDALKANKKTADYSGG